MIRVGIGYDSHRFVAGRPLILAGQRIDHPLGLAGHSDADAVAHAVIDAILGAAALGDVGSLFPDTDPAWKDADSMRLLRMVVTRLGHQGRTVRQVDVTIILEAPRLGVHKLAMATALADALGLGPRDVGVKAKTNEGMGFIGRGEGIAVIAVALLEEART
jgi:2-C-methyl-D-erythritol 2,4-cyclodiphosphate synthase